MFDWLKPSVRQTRRRRADAKAILAQARTLAAAGALDGARRYAALRASPRRDPDVLHQVLALAAAAAHARLGFWVHPEQVMAALALVGPHVVDMKTGEGKTLAALFAAAWHALDRQGVHVVTANGYLVERDAALAREILGDLGVTVGHVAEGQCLEDKRAAYACDVTYATGQELGFDHLRDQLAMVLDEQVQRPLHAVFIDEADALLIDAARTPLVVSGDAPAAAAVYARFTGLVADWSDTGPDAHYTPDLKRRRVALTDRGQAAAEAAIAQWEGDVHQGDAYDPGNLEWFHHLDLALKAKAVLARDHDYLVEDGRIVIIDAATGRPKRGTRWDHGLHQAVESKEGLALTAESRVRATTTLQDYLAGYAHVSGMTGTAMTDREEFQEVYGLTVVEIPTHRPVARVDHPDLLCVTQDDKHRRIVEDIVTRHATGQPILVGAASVEESEALAARLTARGVPHQLLNARQHAREAAIVADAGQLGAVTVAAALAGRGTDIVLGGSPDRYGQAEWAHQHARVVALGGLYVIGTARHESRRVDHQLRGRAGRQGDPGASRFYVSMEDRLLRIFATDLAQGLFKAMGVQDGHVIESPAITRQIERAQRHVEAQHFQARKTLVAFDRVLAVHRKQARALRQAVLEDAWEWGNEDAWGDWARSLADCGVDASPSEQASWRRLPRDVATQAFLRHWDAEWQAFLERLAMVRQGVHLRGMAQQDPLREYQKEAVRGFADAQRAAWQAAAREWSAQARARG